MGKIKEQPIGMHMHQCPMSDGELVLGRMTCRVCNSANVSLFSLFSTNRPCGGVGRARECAAGAGHAPRGVFAARERKVTCPYHDDFEAVIGKTVKVDFVKLTASERDAKRAEEEEAKRAEEAAMEESRGAGGGASCAVRRAAA